MIIKTEYSAGDNAWIHGVSSSNKLTQGTVIASIDLSSQGFTELHYIISIPTHIEPLLEIRTWHTMSQDEKGPIGSFRSIKEMLDSDSKKMRHLGFRSEVSEFDEDPTPDEIMAALEKSTAGLTHRPLNLKENNPKPRKKYYPKRKK